MTERNERGHELTDRAIEAAMRACAAPNTDRSGRQAAADDLAAGAGVMRPDDPRKTAYAALAGLVFVGEVEGDGWSEAVEAAHASSKLWRLQNGLHDTDS